MIVGELLQKEAAKVGIPSRQFGVGGGGLQHAHRVAQPVSGVKGFPAKLEHWISAQEVIDVDFWSLRIDILKAGPLMQSAIAPKF